MKASRQLAIIAALFLQLLRAFGDDVITNVMSPIVSYQYPNDFSSEALTNGGIQSRIASFQFLENFSSAALTNGGITSPLVSYQYFEWPGDDVLHLVNSPVASYYYQFLDAPLLTVIPTTREPSFYETTPQTAFGPPPSPLQLETFINPSFTTNPPFPPDLNKMSVVLTHGWNSSPNEWATNMAALLVGELGASSPNIFAWNWSNAASSASCDPGTPESKTGDEGRALGQALLAKLGPGYSQPLHFVGHSHGTLVNASAANYLHTNGYSSQRTHMTLFDEAEQGAGVNCPQWYAGWLFTAFFHKCLKPPRSDPLEAR